MIDIDQQDCPNCDCTGLVERTMLVPEGTIIDWDTPYEWICPRCKGGFDWYPEDYNE